MRAPPFLLAVLCALSFQVVPVRSVLLFKHTEGGVVQFLNVDEYTSQHNADGWLLFDRGSLIDNPVYQQLVPGKDEGEEEAPSREYELVGIVPVDVRQVLAPGMKAPLHPVLVAAKQHCTDKQVIGIRWYPGDLQVASHKTKAYHGECTYHRPANGSTCPFKYRARYAGEAELDAAGYQGGTRDSHVRIDSRHDHEGEYCIVLYNTI